MRYVVRVVLGAVLGLLAVAVLSWLGVRWWIGGIAGALLALVGFLGSFFLWSADRPAEGYEQVLFDRPNNVVSLALVVVFVAAAYGGGALLHRAAPAGPDPADTALAADHDNLTHIFNAINGDKYAPADAGNATAQIKAAQDDAAKFPGSPKAALIQTAAASLAKGVAEFDGCGQNCRLAAQLAKADILDAKAALDSFAS